MRLLQVDHTANIKTRVLEVMEDSVVLEMRIIDASGQDIEIPSRALLRVGDTFTLAGARFHSTTATNETAALLRKVGAR